jgi:hypothetical protein
MATTLESEVHATLSLREEDTNMSPGLSLEYAESPVTSAPFL